MSTTWLVDGSNVARSAGWREVADHDDERRGRLVDAVVAWAGRERVRVVLAFDGAGPIREGSATASPDVEVVGSGRREGDDLLRRRATKLRRDGVPLVVVTGDHALRNSIARSDREACAVELFVAGLLTREAPRPAPAARPPRDTQLRDGLDPDVRARLEQLRRGLD